MKRGSARDHMPSKEEFEKLLKACELTDHPLLYRFIVLMTGIIGMRIGEVGHIKETWVDFVREIINIPSHEPCNCDYCRNILKKTRKKRTGKKKKNTKTFEEELKEYWKPKTPAGVRSIPFGFNREVKEVLQEVMTKYEECPWSPKQIERRFRYLRDLAGMPHIHAHALRAYAATNFAYAGINAATLQTIMGWDDIETAVKYIRRSGALAEKEFERVFGKKKDSLSKFASKRIFYLTDLGKKLMNRKIRKDDEEWLRCLLNRLHERYLRQNSSVKISTADFKIYQLLTNKNMYQSQIAKKLGIRHDEVGDRIKILKGLGIIEPINPDSIPKFYKATRIVPVVLD